VSENVSHFLQTCTLIMYHGRKSVAQQMWTSACPADSGERTTHCTAHSTCIDGTTDRDTMAQKQAPTR